MVGAAAAEGGGRPVILLLGLLSGMAVIGGVIGMIVGLVGTTAPRRAPLRQRWRALRTGQAPGESARLRRQTLITAATAVFAGVWLVSGNFVGGVLLGASVIGVPWLVSPAQIAQERVGQLEALSEWTQRLAG